MTTDEAKKELMVVHRDSPIGETHEHFYSVSSVNRVIEKLVNKINELENKIELRKYNIGDEVWVKTYSGNVYCNRITGIHIKQDGLIVYSLLNFADRTESELFPTKEELLKSL